MSRHGHGHGRGHGRGGYGYWGGGFFPYYSTPILLNDYKIGGLLNEYDELNSVASKNNATYIQNIIENYGSQNRGVGSTPFPTVGVAVANSLIETRGIPYYGYSGIYPGLYPGIYPGFYGAPYGRPYYW
jgi:hypothetical protein